MSFFCTDDLFESQRRKRAEYQYARTRNANLFIADTNNAVLFNTFHVVL